MVYYKFTSYVTSVWLLSDIKTVNVTKTLWRSYALWASLRGKLDCITRSKPAVKCLLCTSQGIVPTTWPIKTA